MPEFIARSRMPASPAALFAYHERPGALLRLLPPWQAVRVETPGGIHDGERVVLRMGPGPLAVRWVAEHRGFEAGRSFCDVQVRGPFARWEHTHLCLPDEGDPGGSLLEDRIAYALPAGSLGRRLGDRAVRRMLVRMFRFRHARTRADLSQQALCDGAPRRFAVTGATGLVGSSLCAFLRTAGHEVARVTRSPGPEDVGWNPRAGEIDARALEGVDAVVHLAGESVFGLRWTDEKKRAIRESRVAGTRLLAETLAGLPRRPEVLVSASAVGYYGDRGDEALDESSAPGAGFLADVCREWEAATEAAQGAGVRVIHLRIGIVLSSRGGALATQLPPFRLGLGGPGGSGRQITSWISLDDLVYAIHFLAHRREVAGPVNATAPGAVPGREFAATLGRVLRRPAVLPLPGGLLRGVLGQLAEEMLLSGARVRPAALERAGFGFTHPELEGALRMELGRLETPLASEG